MCHVWIIKTVFKKEKKRESGKKNGENTIFCKTRIKNSSVHIYLYILTDILTSVIQNMMHHIDVLYH